MVVPVALPIARSRSTGQSSAANRRDPVIRLLIAVRGANRDTDEVSWRTPRASVRTRAPGTPAAAALLAGAARMAPVGGRGAEWSPAGSRPGGRVAPLRACTADHIGAIPGSS